MTTLRSGCIDLPSKRDYVYGEERLGSQEIPDWIDNRGIYALDQGGANSCTAYALAHTLAIILTRTYKQQVTVDAASMWANQFIYPGTANEAWGDYLQSALKGAKHSGFYAQINGKWELCFIDKYNRIPTEDKMIQALADHRPVYSGIEWFSNAVRDGFWGERSNSIGGHAGCFHSYDFRGERKFFEGINSYGGDWRPIANDPGDFRLDVKDYDKLMSKYVVEIRVPTELAIDGEVVIK
jgi:hypothetical protein